MVIRRIDQKHYQFIAAGAAEDRRRTASPEREAIEAEVQARAYQLWLYRGVRKGSPELDWLIDGRLMSDLARLSYSKLLRIDRLLAKRLAEATESRMSLESDISPTQEGKPSPLVLVVDDNRDVRDFVRYALEENGYSVLTAPDAVSALTLLETFQAQVELVISDIQMPGMSGGTLAELIRQRHAGTRVLLMSGMATDEIPAQWEDAVIHKPFRLDHLLTSVKEALSIAVH